MKSRSHAAGRMADNRLTKSRGTLNPWRHCPTEMPPWEFTEAFCTLATLSRIIAESISTLKSLFQKPGTTSPTGVQIKSSIEATKTRADAAANTLKSHCQKRLIGRNCTAPQSIDFSKSSISLLVRIEIKSPLARIIHRGDRRDRGDTTQTGTCDECWQLRFCAECVLVLSILFAISSRSQRSLAYSRAVSLNFPG
jgi:hypothetical protein